jgi:hypothetical protein
MKLIRLEAHLGLSEGVQYRLQRRFIALHDERAIGPFTLPLWLRSRSLAQLAEVFTVLKVLLMLVPSVVTIPMQATRIRASMTAYSTAVGPSSLVRKREIEVVKRDIDLALFVRHRCSSRRDTTPNQG